MVKATPKLDQASIAPCQTWVINEWRNDDVSRLSIEAAEEAADPRLYNRLTQLIEILELDEDSSFATSLANAIAACKPAAEQGGPR